MFFRIIYRLADKGVVGRVEATITIGAAPEDVWEILVDPHYIPRLYPDMLNIKVDPEGPAAPGQWRTLTGRAGKRMIEFRTKVAEVVPLKRLVIEGRRGGAFEVFSQVMELSEVKNGTEVKVDFHFKVSDAYFGIGFDPISLGKMAEENQEKYIRNLKELAELKRV